MIAKRVRHKIGTRRVRLDNAPAAETAYGHLARDSEEAIRSRLEARGAADAQRQTGQ